MAKILIVSSQVHNLSQRQLDLCVQLVEKSSYDYQIELLQAGTYELPFVIKSYHKKAPFDAYLVLGLVLESNSAHAQYIKQHIATCFTQFALEGIIVGNGILYGTSLETLATNLESQDACLSAYPSAFKAVSALLALEQKLGKLS